jgi:LPXTG-motif cell wall-anchored protein
MDEDKTVVYVYSEVVNIPDDPAPGSDKPENEDPNCDDIIDIPDEEVPLTGDNSYLWTVVTLISAAALAILIFRKKEEA